jgi:hypothetical protein
MEQAYNFLIAHPMYCTIGGLVIAFLLGLVKLDKVKMFAFTCSQFIRKTFGRKVEQKIEDIVDAINEGLKSDNEKSNK